MPRNRSPSKSRSKSTASASRSRTASRGRKPAASGKASAAKKRTEASKSPARKTGKSPGRPKKTAAAALATKPTPSRTTTIQTKVEKEPTPSASGLRPRRGAATAGTELRRQLDLSETRSRSKSAARGRKAGSIVQSVVALPRRAWNAVRIPNAGRRLKRHMKANWKKYLLFLVTFLALSVAYHFSRELSRSVEQLRTQVADFIDEQKKVFGDAIERASNKIEEWTASGHDETHSKHSTSSHQHSHVKSHTTNMPDSQSVTPQPGDALPLDDAI